MAQRRLGFVGWRGMVGSVLLNRMREEADLKKLDVEFYSTSAAGKPAPAQAGSSSVLGDAFDISSLAKHDVIISCQGGGYTVKAHPELRKSGWDGYWIDAASTLRMNKDSVIVLDPVNMQVIESALGNGIKTFVGGNCTVSLMLMALAPLFHHNLVEWLSTMTYQSASGAGAKPMAELLRQMAAVSGAASELLDDPAAGALELDRLADASLRSETFPTEHIGVPLAASLIPWIDRAVEQGQTREEWKGLVETNKILGREDNPVPVDGICVRVGVLRCHSQAFTIKLTRDVPLDELEGILSDTHEWTELIPNDKEATFKRLTPAAVSGTLSVPIGRVHKLNMGPEYLGAFSVGDQLLWGAAEPLRRMLRIVEQHLEG